jgi:hypothetical protein
MSENTAGADDEIVHSRGDLIDIWCADENAEGVVLNGNLPRPWARLRQMDLAIPTGHDCVLDVTAGSSEAKPFPEGDRGGKVVVRNYCERADRRGNWHRDSP